MYDELISVKQYAHLKGVKHSTVKSWVYRGQLPVVLIAGRTFIAKGAHPTHVARH